MRVIALMKQVPDRNSAFRAEGSWIDESSLGYGVNDYDRYAVEAALALREEGAASEAVVVTAGPPDAGQAIRTCLAMGMDRAVHLVCPRGSLADPFRVATALAAVVEREEAGVTFAGLLAEDSGHGQVGGLVAGLLGHAYASAVTAIRWRSDRLEVERELEGGRAAVVELDLPAVVAVQTGANLPRYASLRGIMASRRKPVERIESPELAAPEDRDTALRSLRLRRPERAASAERLEGSPDEIAAELIPRLRAGAGIALSGGAS